MRKKVISFLCVLFWLLLWQIGAMLLDSELLLVTPVRAVTRLFELIPSAIFWKSVLFSSARIMLGFLLGVVFGTVFGILAGRVKFIKTLLSPLVAALKAVPVASITVLILIWIGSENLSVPVSLIISFPIMYSNMSEGIENLDPKLSEMADLFQVPFWRKFTGVYLSQLLPYFRSAARLAVGLSWKSGTAAEIIGIPSGSIGERLYQAKIYLETADLFAWTIAVILLSFLTEKLFLFLTGLAVRAVSGGKSRRNYRKKDAKNYPAPTISIKNLTKSYGENKVISDFNCEIPAGKTAVIMGRSGCGKTTLISLITGLIKPDGGSIEFNPEAVKFSAVFQENRLCENLTAAANIRLVTGNTKSRAEILSALSAAGLSEVIDKPVKELSGGMKRRVALVRAMLAEYGVIVLDEPFKGLDEDTKSGVADYCKKQLENKTAVIVTHDKTECDEFADKIIYAE